MRSSGMEGGSRRWSFPFKAQELGGRAQIIDKRFSTGASKVPLISASSAMRSIS